MSSVRPWALASCVLTAIACHRPAADDTRPQTVEADVVWPQGGADPQAVAALARATKLDPAALASRIARARVPVLAPGHRAMERATLVVQPTFVALTAREPGVTVAIQSSRVAKVIAGLEVPPPTHALRGTKGYVSVNEGIRTATWIENGVTYSVDVECASPTDALCQDDRYLLEVVDGLVFVGGSGL